MKLKKVIITGAPGTGKSSIIKELKNRGYFCFDEVWEKEYKNGGPVRVAIARGCGKVMSDRRKKTKYYT